MVDDEQNRFKELTQRFGEGISEEAKQAQEDLRLREKYTQLIGRLDAEQLGRAIVITHKGPEKAEVRQKDNGVELSHTPSPQQKDLIGYVLPLNKDDSAHIVVFTDGTMLKVEPKTPHSLPFYQERHSPNAAPQDMAHNFIHTVEGAIDLYRKSTSHIKITDTNNTAEGARRFSGYFDQAINLASELKMQRDQARRTSMQGFVDKFGDFLNRKPPQAEPPPPQG